MPIKQCSSIAGEVGSSWPITDFEKRAIKASAEVQSVLGCGVTFHPGELNLKNEIFLLISLLEIKDIR